MCGQCMITTNIEAIGSRLIDARADGIADVLGDGRWTDAANESGASAERLGDRRTQSVRRGFIKICPIMPFSPSAVACRRLSD